MDREFEDLEAHSGATDLESGADEEDKDQAAHRRGCCRCCMVPGSASSSWAAGEAKKSTYGTGGFILLNTREEVTQPSHGLLSTIAYKIGPYVTTNYALESSIAIAGPVVKWLRDSLEIISSAVEIEILAGSVQDSGGIYFVPHSGLCNHGSHCSRGAQEYVLVLLGE
jgi:hypothetical protein